VRQTMSHRLGEKWIPDVTRLGCLPLQDYYMKRGLKCSIGLMEVGRSIPVGNESSGSVLTEVVW
jgi:hypothetical protein